MSINVLVTDKAGAAEGMDRLLSFSSGRHLYANTCDASFDVTLKNGKRVLLFGELFYHIRSNGGVKTVDTDSTAYLKVLFSESALKDIVSSLEGQYIGLLIDSRAGSFKVFCDRYARVDTFYAEENGAFYLSTDLDDIFKNISPVYDQLMLAHMFAVYGWYTPKGLTIYKNVKQPKVGEILTVSGNGVSSEAIKFKPMKIEDYEDGDLDTYYGILKDSVLARAEKKGKTWVSSSSGWDSSVILGMLVSELGAKNVGMITGSMKYSKGTKVINKFEMDKINKIGRFYGLKPNIIDFNYKDKSAVGYWEKVLPHYKSRHMYSYVSFNFAKLSDCLTNVAGEGRTIFNGETSDSFHNFGFSQFATFFHTQKTFTEYADKMNCYLYGPSFFKKVTGGTYEKDKVYQIFKKMNAGTEFLPRPETRQELIEGYLFPLFYGGPRLPFARNNNNPALTPGAQEGVFRFPFRQYMPEVADGLKDDNIYSWFIYLYHSFHSQGSTVNIHKHGMEYNDHRWRSPFNDYRMVEFLSKAPESWGRGLELNNTKYPLKWVARNKIKFPYELLNEGPHSYLYDVLEGFSLFAEITYRSGVSGFFKEKLAGRPYRNILSSECFDLKYLDRLTADYLAGKETRGQDFNNLVSLITLCVTGWY